MDLGNLMQIMHHSLKGIGGDNSIPNPFNMPEPLMNKNSNNSPDNAAMLEKLSDSADTTQAPLSFDSLSQTSGDFGAQSGQEQARSGSPSMLGALFGNKG